MRVTRWLLVGGIVAFWLMAAVDPLELFGKVSNVPAIGYRLTAEHVPLNDEIDRVIFLVPHIDDEALFAGTTIPCLYKHLGPDKITIVYTTTSTAGRPNSRNRRYAQQRRRTVHRVLHDLGVPGASVVFPATLHDGRHLSSHAKLPPTLKWVCQQIGPVTEDTLLFTIAGDGNPDHEVAYRAGRAIARDAGIPLYVYWGYGKDRTLWTQKDKRQKYPEIRSAYLSASRSPEYLNHKYRALMRYEEMYRANGWRTGPGDWYPDIIRYSKGHYDELGVLIDP